ncbi:MAG TPA: metalloregulator ArsR/SmtB family transcription factor [Terriglobales bacterium]
MGKLALTPEVMVLIAERFKALAKPARLQILNCLRSGEFTVSELVEETELGQTNVSKHLQLLYAMGFVSRRKEGSSCTMLSPTVACSTSAT